MGFALQAFKDLLTLLKSVYERSPITFSSITGLHHPDIPRLSGHFLLGRAHHFAKERGVGLGVEVEHLAKLALAHPRGMAYCSLINKAVVLVTRPSEIEQILIFNNEKVDRSKTLETFRKVFGEHNVFNRQTDDEWASKRAQVKEWLLSENALTELTSHMQAIIDEFYDKYLREHAEVPSLESFLVALAMDVFARSRLGAEHLGENAKILSHTLTDVFRTATDPKNYIWLRLGALKDYFKIKKETIIDKAKINLQTILDNYFLKPNLTTITQTRNMLRKYFDDHSQDQQKACAAANEDAGILLLAGHETTSRLLQFTLMILAQKPDIFKKLSEEVAFYKPLDDKWDLEGLNKLSYLDKILKESLRLYPPVPIFGRVVTQRLLLADINRVNNKKEYHEALKNRNVKNDIILKPGTFILVSPRITQRLPDLYENPLEFNPERHNDHSITDLTLDRGNFFPFGLGYRNCIGRKFALQEAKLVLLRLVEKYKFNIDEACKFETYIHGTLRCKGQVSASFVRNEA